MRSYLLSLCLLAPVFLGGCFEPAHYCPAPIEECEYGYVYSDAETPMEGEWNGTEIEKAVEKYGFSVTYVVYRNKGDPNRPGHLDDGSARWQMFSGIWKDTRNQSKVIHIFADRWVGEDRVYNITVNVSYTGDHETVHYLPRELSEADRDRQQAIVKPQHADFIRHLKDTLGWRQTNATEWRAVGEEKPDSVRRMEERQGLWD